MNRHERRSKKHTQVYGHARVFDMVQYITGYLEVESMNDLNAQMQDQVMAALEKKSDELGIPLVIKAIRCDVDHDQPDDSGKRFFLHIVASEIVAVATKRENGTLQ